ncbi:MAG: peptidoglycan-binding protein [Symploca sp. SIO2C1]|nr:peptidoglycan-binding protein [Symploca sp. SIO2C1]
METLAYIHLALADETPRDIGVGEGVDWRKFSSKALIYLLPVIAVTFGILGMANETLAQRAGPGDRNYNVTLIQRRLGELGYFNRTPTGIFGEITKRAVEEFQRINGLRRDGIVGPETEEFLFFQQAVQPKPTDRRTILRRGDEGEDVRQLQEWLTVVNYNPGSINGVYGSQTEFAVRQFQAARRLPVTGIANERTLQELEAAYQAIATDSPDDNVDFIFYRGRTLLRKGDKGEDVEEVQGWLTDIGFNPGWIDGDYGSVTQSAVSQFQRENNLPVTGVANKQTLQKIEQEFYYPEIAQPSPTPPDKKRYVVVVPGDENTLVQVQQYISSARQGDDRRGKYVNVHAFDNRNDAESWSYWLRARGFNARVAYF